MREEFLFEFITVQGTPQTFKAAHAGLYFFSELIKEALFLLLTITGIDGRFIRFLQRELLFTHPILFLQSTVSLLNFLTSDLFYVIRLFCGLIAAFRGLSFKLDTLCFNGRLHSLIDLC